MGIKTKISIALSLLSSAAALIMGAKGAEVDLRPLVIPPLSDNNATQEYNTGIFPLYRYLVLNKNLPDGNSTPNPTIPEKIMGLLKDPKNNVIIISDRFRKTNYEDLPHGDFVASVAIAEIIRLNKGKLPHNTYVIGIDYNYNGEYGEFLDQLNKTEIKAKVYINFSWFFDVVKANQQNIDRITSLAENPNVKVFIANGNAGLVSGLAFGAQCLPNVYPVAATNTTIGSGNIIAEIAPYSTRLPNQLKTPGSIFDTSRFGVFDVNGDGRADFSALEKVFIQEKGTSLASPAALTGVFMVDIFNKYGIKPSPEIEGIKTQVQLAKERKGKLCDSNGRLIEEPKGRG
ncbi:MAG: S8/S53 family peptidase [Alphaproteobacteria bacterium]|jgi:hypothetical protein